MHKQLDQQTFFDINYQNIVLQQSEITFVFQKLKWSPHYIQNVMTSIQSRSKSQNEIEFI